MTSYQNYCIILYQLKDDGTLLLYYPNLVINLFDYDNDGNSDALVSEGAFNGALYYLINNINDPQLLFTASVHLMTQICYMIQKTRKL